MQHARKMFALLPEHQHARMQGMLTFVDAALLTWRGGLWFAFGISVFALGFALIAQYGFGFKPCVLCLWQRVPYLLCGCIAALALAVPRLRLWRGALLLACTVLLFTDAGIAFFHTGVEQHWWMGTSGCSIQPKTAQDAAGLREALLASPVAHCDEVSWTFIGLSMATWNMVFALFCALFCAFIVFFGKPEQAAPRALRYGKDSL